MSKNVHEVIKSLCNMGITGISVSYHDSEKDILFYNLNTGAKSGLLLSEDFWVYGRYDYCNKIDPDQEMNSILEDLFYEFKTCLHGRDYYNSEWMELGVKLGIVEKKTKTSVEYVFK